MFRELHARCAKLCKIYTQMVFEQECVNDSVHFFVFFFVYATNELSDTRIVYTYIPLESSYTMVPQAVVD